MTSIFTQIRYDTEKLRANFDQRKRFQDEFKSAIVELCDRFDSLSKIKTDNYAASLDESCVSYCSGVIELLHDMKGGTTQSGKKSISKEANEFRILVNSIIQALALAKNTIESYADQSKLLSDIKEKLSTVKVPTRFIGQKAFEVDSLHSVSPNSVSRYLTVLSEIGLEVIRLRDHLAGLIKKMLMKKQVFSSDLLSALGLQGS